MAELWSDSDSDGSGGLTRLHSNPVPPEFDYCPENIEFHLKLKKPSGRFKRFIYTLKAGVPLPYTLPGEYQVTFSRGLKPVFKDIIGRTEVIEGQQYWSFEGQSFAVNQSTSAAKSKQVSSGRIPDAPNANEDIEGLESIESDAPGESVAATSGRSDRTGDGLLVDVRQEAGNTGDTDIAVEMGSASVSASVQTVHTNPDWCKILKLDFKTLVISRCCLRTKEAIEANENIKDPKAWKYTENEVINTTITHLENVFGGAGSPKMKDLREIAATLQHIYPAMFLASVGNGGEGLHGYGKTCKILDLNGLASKLAYRFRDRAVKKPQKRAATEGGEDVEIETPKRGKHKDYYGVDNQRFLGRKVTPASVTAISRTSDEEDEAAREAIYEDRRDEIQYVLRTSPNNIHNILRGFFLSPLHLIKQFEFVTRAKDLTDQVRANLSKQLDLLEKYLVRADPSIDMQEKLTAANTMCQVEFNGSTLYRDIQVLRLAGDHLDKDGSALMRLSSDSAVTHNSPFILAVQVDKTFIFEVWCEQKKLFGNLDMAQGIAGFLHLSFVFDFKYPQAAQTLADIIQRLIARYGDYTGTRTHGSKITAKSKFDRFMRELGMILSEV